MRIKRNTTGGLTIIVGRLSIWTDLCEKFWDPVYVNSRFRISLYLGWLNFSFVKKGAYETHNS